MSKTLSLQQLEQETGLSGLTLELHDFINFDKDKIKETASIMEQSIKDGFTSEIDGLIFAKKISTLADELDTRIRPLANGKSYGKDYTRFGVKVTESMQGVRYEFGHCEDPVYDRLNAIFETAKKELDERKDLLKTVTKPVEMYDPETSEVFICKPPVKSGKLGLMLTIK